MFFLSRWFKSIKRFSDYYSGNTLLNPIKLMYLLESIDTSNRSFSKLSPCVQLGSIVVLRHLKTGIKQNIKVETPKKVFSKNNILSVSSSTVASLVSKKVGDLADYSSDSKRGSWVILNVRAKDE